MSALAGVSAEGVVGWGVMSRPELNLSADWGRTVETVEIEGLALPDWRRADKQGEKELGAVGFNEWILDFASRFSWLTVLQRRLDEFGVPRAVVSRLLAGPE